MILPTSSAIRFEITQHGKRIFLCLEHGMPRCQKKWSLHQHDSNIRLAPRLQCLFDPGDILWVKGIISRDSIYADKDVPGNQNPLSGLSDHLSDLEIQN